MIVHTKGLVLGHIKYAETSIIAKIFTEKLGYGSFLVHSVRSKKSRKGVGCFQPFGALNLVIYHKESRNIQRITEFDNYFPFFQILNHTSKSTIALFLSEVLNSLLKAEQHSNKNLYHYLENAVLALEKIDQGVNHFHLQFLLKLCPYLGFSMKEVDILHAANHKFNPTKYNLELLRSLIYEPFGNQMNMSEFDRNTFLNSIINFYHHHASLSQIKSLKVLRNMI